MAPLTEAQRYQIEHDIRLGLDNQMIATGVGCSGRTIEREVSRCGGRVPYRAEHALFKEQLQVCRDAAFTEL